MLAKLAASWKTTASGLLSFLIATQVAILVPGSPIQTSNPKLFVWLTIMCGVLKAWLGLLMQDAGTVVATPKDGGAPQVMPSHEVPDAKGAVPVSKQ